MLGGVAEPLMLIPSLLGFIGAGVHGNQVCLRSLNVQNVATEYVSGCVYVAAADTPGT